MVHKLTKKQRKLHETQQQAQWLAHHNMLQQHATQPQNFLVHSPQIPTSQVHRPPQPGRVSTSSASAATDSQNVSVKNRVKNDLPVDAAQKTSVLPSSKVSKGPTGWGEWGK